MKPIVLIGRSASGKDTLLAELCALGMERIKTCSTRPGAKEDGYIALSDEEFELSKKQGRFAETAEYVQHDGVVFKYGSLKESYADSDIQRVTILNPVGVKKLKEIGADFTLVYLDVSPEECMKRALNRGRQDAVHIAQRTLQDEKDFKDVLSLNPTVIVRGEYTPSDMAKAILIALETGDIGIAI